VSENSTGARALLTHPRLYEAFSTIVGGRRAREVFIREHVRPDERSRVLDLGCGPGELRTHLPAGVTYVGVDISAAYIDRARERFGASAELRVGDATSLDDDLRDFDLVMAVGVLHHLDDEGVLALLRGSARAMSGGGRLVSVDPAFWPPQSAAARAVIKRDRGQHVRETAEYAQLARSVFTHVIPSQRTDLLRIPYTHCVLECRSPLRDP